MVSQTNAFRETIVVTGAAGFIGSNLCHKLLSEDRYFVVGIDGLLSGSNRRNLNGLYDHWNFKFHNCDLRTYPKVLEFLRLHPRTKYLVHCAAESSVDRSISDDNAAWTSNVTGTANLLRAALELRGLEKIINIITDEAYGPLVKGSAKEGSALLPTSPYAASKASQYLVGKSYVHTHQSPIISTFPTNNFGPRQYPEKLIPKFISRLSRGQKVPLMRSTHFVREWLAVDDHVNAILRLLDKGKVGEDYNIGSGVEVSNLEITKNLLAIMGFGEDRIEIVDDRKAHDCRYSVQCSKMKKLGWQPQQNFDAYLNETVAWYLSNRSFLQC